MASKSKETRLKQKAQWEAQLQKRLAQLSAQGCDETKISRDVLVKKLKAGIKESQERLRAIDANEKRTAELAARKAERLAKPEPKEEAPKAKKSAEPPPETKPKRKKKKEEESQPPEA